MNAWIADITTKRRDKLLIIAEIMEIAEKGTYKTLIMYKANLSFTQLNEYLDLLVKRNLLEKTSSNEREIYRTTSKGKDFLERQREVIKLLNEDKIGKASMRIPARSLLSNR